MLMSKLALILLLLSSGAVAQERPRDPAQLTRYIQDAQRAGLKSAQIREKAVQAGWSASDVDAMLNAGEERRPSETVPGDAAKSLPQATAAPQAPAKPQPAERADVTQTAPVTDAANAVAKGNAEGVRSDDYQIGEGDVLQVAVWGEPAASVQSATVRPDGKISMPLIKEVTVAGSTPAQVEARIQEQLSKVIRTPDVTVIVAQINSKKIFLTGAVKREGPLKYTYRMTVLQAISEAGGLTDYAKRKNIYVLHTENGRQFRLPFNYNAVLKGENMEQNILLSPGDTIVVP
jgi:polysaccharide export outer membrane protein